MYYEHSFFVVYSRNISVRPILMQTCIITPCIDLLLHLNILVQSSLIFKKAHILQVHFMKFLISPPLSLVNFRRGVGDLQVGYAVLPTHFIANSLSTRGVRLIIPIYIWYREVWNKSRMFWTNKVILCLTFLLWFLHFITLNYGHKVGFVFLRIWNYTFRGDHLRMSGRNCCNSRI